MKSYQTHFQSANLSDEEIKANFIVRQDELDKITGDLRRTKKNSSFQHYVFIGRRGSGKSTLLRRIQAEINLDTKLKKQYLAVRLSEEQSGVYKIYDLWDKVIQDLQSSGYEIENLDFRDYKYDVKEYARRLHIQVIEYLRKNKKRLVLLIDNIDRIFKNIGKDAGLLREMLMNYLDIRIIGGSTYMSEQFWRYDLPFYDFFALRRLEPLTLDEIHQLLNHWSIQKGRPEIAQIIDKHPGKIQSIRMLTDGTPRTMLIFVDMLINRPEQHGFEYLQVIVDKATPIYQERLGTLSAAQQKVLTELAFFWEAIAVNNLVDRCNMAGKTISALLNQLTKLHYVEKIKGETKNNFYRVEERFFNLWIIMTQGGPQQRMEAKYLTDFLENWYDEEELQKVYMEFVSQVNQGKIKAEYAMSMSRALMRSKYLDRTSKQDLYYKVKLTGGFPDNILGRAEDYLGDLHEDIKTCIISDDFKEAVKLLEMSSLDEDVKMFGLGICYSKIGNIDSAKKYLKNAASLGISQAFYSLGVIFMDENNLELAREYHLKGKEAGVMNSLISLSVIEMMNENWAVAEELLLEAIKKGATKALALIGDVYRYTERIRLSEEYYLKGIKAGERRAYNGLTKLYIEIKEWGKAEALVLEAIEVGYNRTLGLLGDVYRYTDRLPQAEESYRKGIEINDWNSYIGLSKLYIKNKKWIEAKELLLKASEKGIERSLGLLGDVYYETGKFDLAEENYLKAIKAGYLHRINDLLIIYYFNGNNEKLKEAIYHYRDNSDEVLPRVLLPSLLKIGDMVEFKSVFSKIDFKIYDYSDGIIKDLLVYEQYALVNRIFDQNKGLIGRYKPLYYASKILSNSKGWNQDVIPPELIDNVLDIVNGIKNRRNFHRHA